MSGAFSVRVTDVLGFSELISDPGPSLGHYHIGDYVLKPFAVG